MDKVNITSKQVTKWGDQLRHLYFKGNTTIKFDDLAQDFQKMSETEDKAAKKKAEKGKKKKDEPKARYRWEREDRVKVALIYFLEGVLFSSDVKWDVSSVYMSMVDELDTFNVYPWGLEVFETIFTVFGQIIYSPSTRND